MGSGGAEQGAGNPSLETDCHLLLPSQLVLQLLQIRHLLCLCPQENQPYLGLMGHLLAVRKWRR